MTQGGGMTDEESRELADRMTAHIAAGEGMTLTAVELANVGKVAGDLHAINEQYRVMFETIAQAFDAAGVKVVLQNGAPTLVNVEKETVN